MSRILFITVLSLLAPRCVAEESNVQPLDQPAVLQGLREFYRKTARPDGSFQPGIDPDYLGMSDSVYSDLAAVTYACTIHRTFGWQLPHERETIDFLLSRQKTSGEFFNVAGTVDPQSPQGRTYNSTQALVALRALRVKPRHDPLPVFEEILKQDYKTLPAYSTSFFPLAYLCYGKPIPEQADRAIRALMIQDDDGYLNDHVAATFHASHYYGLVGEATPKSEQIVARVLRDQKPDGSWFLNLPSRDRHATFDAVFTLRHEGTNRADCQAAIQRAARWALSCRNADGGFGHFPGSASDADAVYFQVGTLVMAGFLKSVDPLPTDPHLLSWGHLMPLRTPTKNAPVRLAHAGWVGGVAFSPDGKTLATSDSARHVYLWETDSGKPLHLLKDHADCVVAVAFSPDGKSLVTGSYDQTAKIWDTRSRQVRHTLTGHRGAVTSVAYAPDGIALATAGIDQTIRLWNAETGKHQRTLAGHKSWVNSLAFSPDSKTLVSGSSDGTLKIWSIASGEVVLAQTLDSSRAEVRTVAFSPNSKYVAAGIRYGAIKIWDTESWKEFQSWTSPADDVWSVAFTADSRRLFASAGEWNRPTAVALWNVADAKQVAEFKHTGEVLSIAVSPDGKSLAAGGTDKTASIWQVVLLAIAGPSPEIIAHRGESFDAPENTLAAFRLAWERKVKAIELDVHLTQDGQLIISHDKDTQRTTGQNIAIKDSKLDQLRVLDAGRWKGERWGGEKMPTLEEALATIPEGARCFIEIKVSPEAVPAVVKAVQASGKRPDQLAIISFKAETIAEAKRQLPRIEAYYLSGFKQDKVTGAWSPTVDELIDQAKAIHADGLDLSYEGPVNREFVRHVKDAGLKFYVWTVDDAKIAQQYAAWGADGITTNRAGWLAPQLSGSGPAAN